MCFRITVKSLFKALHTVGLKMQMNSSFDPFRNNKLFSHLLGKLVDPRH